MGGGLLQLVAYGAQDVYLTGNPQITFFKVVYRRHTNFAIEAIEQTFNGSPAYGSRVTCQISRNGDLIHRTYLVVTLPIDNSTAYCNYFGLRLLNYVEIEIGGQRIDRHYSHWMYIWNELSLPDKKSAYYDMVLGKGGVVTAANNVLHIPLEFWFCRNVGLALPLIALQYHEVKININFEAASLLGNASTTLTTNFTASLWVDYIYLDTDERRRFAQLSHEYLIEQLQFTGAESLTTSANYLSAKVKLNFNHPVKELIWVTTNSTPSLGFDNNNWFNYTTRGCRPYGSYISGTQAIATGTTSPLIKNNLTYEQTSYLLRQNPITSPTVYSKNPTGTVKLVLNGNDRFAERPGSYFNIVQPYQHHENIPNNAGINVYSFSLRPEDHQPSGSLNMSRIDTAVLNLNTTKVTLSLSSSSTNNTVPIYNYNNASLLVYAVNYNVLRILSGMGGLAYSN